jgi:hypothetical protein
MEDFRSKFWRRMNCPRTKEDSTARVVMDRVERVFGRKKQGLVVRLLDMVSDPTTEKRLRRVGQELNAQIFLSLFRSGPSRKEVRNLNRRLQTIARDLESFGAKRVSFKADFFVKLADDCRSGARHLKYFDMARAMDPIPKVPRTLTFKAFWKHVPIAKLCRELEVPWALSFEQVEILLRCAYSVRNLPWVRRARSIEREYNNFRKAKSSDPRISAAWPKMLDRFLLLDLAAK